MIHKIHHGQNRGEAKKCKLSKKRKLSKNRVGNLETFDEIGGIYEYFGNRGNMQYASLT